MLTRAGDHVPFGACMHMKPVDMNGTLIDPGSEHAHGQLPVPPPPPVYAPRSGPPHVTYSSIMFVHSDRSQLSAGEKKPVSTSTAVAPLQYWPAIEQAAHGCSESTRVAAAGPARRRRVADECMELLLEPQREFCLTG